MADQNRVCINIHNFITSKRKAFKTEDLHESMKGLIRKLDYQLMEFISKSDSSGILTFIDRKLLSIDVFNRIVIYLEYFHTIFKNVSVEIEILEPKENIKYKREVELKVLELFLD